MASVQKLTGLRPQAYEHPSDTAALNALTSVKGLDLLVRKLNSWSFDRLLRVQLTGSFLKVTADSFPDLNELLVKACDTLDLPSRPDLYVGSGGGTINAFTACVDQPLIMLTAGAVDALTPEELLFVIAHEVGHIKSGHVLYYQIAEFIPLVGEIVGAATLGFGEWLSAPLQLALMHWQRMSEFTADRAGLLACQDAEVALRTMMKLAGLPAKYFPAINTQDFIKQARDFTAMETEKLNLIAKWLSTMGATHPWTVMRAQHLLQWIDSGEYGAVLKAPQRLPFHAPSGITGYCDQCGRALTGLEQFCPICGRQLAQGHAAKG
jgi:Zn-dependent protease with chaperone function